MSAGALNETEMAALLAPFAHLGPFALAVSGGPDSTAMMGICALMRAGRGDIVVTVDHGLRSESRSEAEATVAAAHALGFEGVVHSWRGEKPASGLQEAARDARYALIQRFAERRGIRDVMLAHTLDDQAETVLMRLMHGSGLRGLAGMRRVAERAGLCLVRPLLSVPKARLVATCIDRGWPFSTDPTNSNPAFLRPRLRALLPVLAAEGLTAARLAVLAERAAQADALLDQVARAGLAESDAVLKGRDLSQGAVSAPVMLGHGREKAVRMLEHAIRKVDPETRQALPLERLERLAERLIAAFAGEKRYAGTIAGIKVVLNGEIVRFSIAPPRRRRLMPPAR